MDHAVIRNFAARPLTDLVLDAALTVIVDAVAGDYDRPTFRSHQNIPTIGVDRPCELVG